MSRYTKKEFVQREGITEPILNGWIYDHGLPVIKIGRRTYIDEADFRQWWDNHRTSHVFVPEPVKAVEPPRSQKHATNSKIASKLRLAR